MLFRSPADYNFDETMSTLRYANRAKNIKNKPKINEDPKDTMLREFKEEIERLRKMLSDQAGGANVRSAGVVSNSRVKRVNSNGVLLENDKEEDEDDDEEDSKNAKKGKIKKQRKTRAKVPDESDEGDDSPVDFDKLSSTADQKGEDMLEYSYERKVCKKMYTHF